MVTITTTNNKLFVGIRGLCVHVWFIVSKTETQKNARECGVLVLLSCAVRRVVNRNDAMGLAAYHTHATPLSQLLAHVFASFRIREHGVKPFCSVL